MTIGKTVRNAERAIKAIGLSLALFAAPAIASTAPAAEKAPAEATATDAAAAAPAASAAATPAAAPVAETAKVDPNNPKFKVAPGKYTPMKPTIGKGMPVPGSIGLQEQFSPNGHQAKAMHDTFLMPVMIAITILVLVLLLYVMIRFNKRANPVPSKTSHNTLLEVLWTGIPVLILVVIAVPSVALIKKQYEPAPEDAVTVKVTGSQWLWTYKYPDNGDVEVISTILSDEKADAAGEPRQLAVDNRMVVPAGEPIRLQVIGADVIHSFAVPSLWFKIDAVPGKINERMLFIEKPGVYYGQCSELCGAKHGYMPIVVEALPRAEFNRWVLEQGGKIDGMPEAPAAAEAVPAAEAKPAA